MRRDPKLVFGCASVLVVGIALACLGRLAAQEPAKLGNELAQAPPDASARQNPYQRQPDAVVAGKKLYRRHCATCHGAEGRGRDKAPDLHSPIIQKASPGTLFWFLRNGNLREGMPSWSRLPDQRLWQIITYLKTLE
jgi:cytochrome c oxidase cbb3-type subunit 2